MNKTLVRTLSGLLFVGVMVGGLLLGRIGFPVLFMADHHLRPGGVLDGLSRAYLR